MWSYVRILAIISFEVLFVPNHVFVVSLHLTLIFLCQQIKLPSFVKIYLFLDSFQALIRRLNNVQISLGVQVGHFESFFVLLATLLKFLQVLQLYRIVVVCQHKNVIEGFFLFHLHLALLLCVIFSLFLLNLNFLEHRYGQAGVICGLMVSKWN